MANPTQKKQLEKPVIDLPSSAGESLPLRRSRRLALETYRSIPVPNRVIHHWKYAKPTSFFPLVNPRVTGPQRQPLVVTGGYKNELRISANGIAIASLTPQARQAGVTIGSLRDAGAPVPGNVVAVDHGLLESMNQALWSAGAFIRIPATTTLDAPIYINLDADDRLPFYRIHIEVETQAQCRFVETVTGKKGQTVGVAEWRIADGAMVEHTHVSSVSASAAVHLSHRARIGVDARYRLITGHIGDGLFKGDLGAILQGAGANSTIASFAMPSNNGQFDLNTTHRHMAPNTKSEIVYRAVGAEDTRCGNTGVIFVDRNAAGTEAVQGARNLLLSEHATATAIPELEILTNDVICSHGAATGTLDPEQLFYMAARGLDRTHATRLIVEGRLMEIAGHLSSAVRDIFIAQFADAMNRDYE